MKKFINLLPKEIQREASLEKLSSRLWNLLVWILLSVGILLLMFLAARIYLKSELSRVNTRIELQQQVVSQEKNRELKRQLDEFNTDLRNYVTLEENQAFWSEVLIAFARLVPQDVAIDTFLAERETLRIRVTGFAKSRDSVLRLRNNLLDSEYFENVNFPLSNLIKPNDVNFTYTFYVNGELLIPSENE